MADGLGYRVMRGVGSGVVMIAATWALGEALIRKLDPAPRVQVIRTTHDGRLGTDVTVRHGQPTWEEAASDVRRNEACQGARHVVIFGTSISYGVYFSAEESLAVRLQALLDAAQPGGWCVHGYAQPAFTGWTKLALAEDVLPTLKPDLVLWEVWGNEGDVFTPVGPDWYNFHGRHLDAAGLPAVPLLPAPVNAALFGASALYRYGLLALAPVNVSREEGRADLRDRLLPKLGAVLGATPAVFYAPCYLDRPLGPQADQPSDVVVEVSAWAAARSSPFIHLADVWRDEDPAPLRSDYCHWSPTGSARAAEVLAPYVLSVR